MAKRLNPKTGQWESYDPSKDVVAPFKKQDTGATSGGGQTGEIKAIDKKLIKTPEYDTNTLAGRYAAAGVLPHQPGMLNELSMQLSGLYKGQNPTMEEITAENEKNRLAAITEENAPLLEKAGSPAGIDAGVEETTFGASLLGATPDIMSQIPSLSGATLGGATAGIAIGTAIAPGVGTLIGGAIGGVVGAGATIVAQLKEEEKQNTKVQVKGLDNSKTSITALINSINADPSNAPTYVSLINREYAKIDAYQSNLRRLEGRDWLSKAKDELTKIETFNSGGERNLLNLKLRDALTNPDSSKILSLPNIPIETGLEE